MSNWCDGCLCSQFSRWAFQTKALLSWIYFLQFELKNDGYNCRVLANSIMRIGLPLACQDTTGLSELSSEKHSLDEQVRGQTLTRWASVWTSASNVARRWGRPEILIHMLWCPPFSSHVHVRTNHLATKCNYYVRLLN